MNQPDDEELNDMAYKEFEDEVEETLLQFEHLVDEKTGTLVFNERNIKLVLENVIELNNIAAEFTPYFNGHNDTEETWDFTDILWETIWNVWKIRPH